VNKCTWKTTPSLREALLPPAHGDAAGRGVANIHLVDLDGVLLYCLMLKQRLSEVMVLFASTLHLRVLLLKLNLLVDPLTVVGYPALTCTR